MGPGSLSRLRQTAYVVAVFGFALGAPALGQELAQEQSTITGLPTGNGFRLENLAAFPAPVPAVEFDKDLTMEQAPAGPPNESGSTIVVDREKEKPVAVDQAKAARPLAPDLAEWDRRLIARGKTPPQRGWSKTLARMEAAYYVLRTVEIVQTMRCLDRPTCHETNPILGRRPSKSTLLAFAGGVALATSFIAHRAARSDRSVAKAFLGVMAGAAGVAVVINYNELK